MIKPCEHLTTHFMSLDRDTKLDIGNVTLEDNISWSQEKTRVWLAKGIFTALVLVIITVLILSFFVDTNNSKVFNSVISGLMGLLGIVLGFYFAQNK